MDKAPKSCELAEEDLRAALREMGTYLDVTEEDLKKIYAIALRHAQHRLTARFSVRDLMTTNVIKVRDDAEMEEVTHLLSENRISGLPVVDGDDRVIGVVTEADILAMAGMKRGHGFKNIIRHLLGEPLPGRRGTGTLREVMTSPAITTMPDADIGAVASILDEKRIKRLPVVNERGRLIGIISRADIVRAIGAK